MIIPEWLQVRRTPLDGGVFVLGATAGAVLLSLLLKPVLDPNLFPLFIVAVFLASRFYGFWYGLACTTLSAAGLLYFFYWTTGWQANTAVRMGSFVLVSLLISWMNGSLRKNRSLLAATLAGIGDAVIATDREGRLTFMNPIAESLTGVRQAEARRRPIGEIFHILAETTRDPLPNPVQQVLSQGGPSGLACHIMVITKDGTELAIEDSAAPIRDEEGKVRGVILVFRDITARRQLEEQVSHAQKMDAVGRFAAGVAGDFNNLLTVITGYSELLRAELAPANPLRRFAEEIMYAAERTASLTRQLLAFSRGQAAQPKLIDLNAMLHNMEAMLRRFLGENIEVVILTGTGLARVKADPGQIEQVIMNLASNARDAMPNGGKLVIETANVDLEDPAGSKKVGVKPGSYVMIAVSDTGVGMDAETRSRLFEPFFTTKEQGKGSGLGLSTVYGMVKQADGHITVYSQANCGTIFEVYLPRATESGRPVPAGPGPVGSETILLVDDEDGVLKLVSAILQSKGYTVLEASGGQAALTAYDKNSHKIDLVLTDVVMPQMNGFELGERLTDRRADLKILYMSGYRDNPIGNQEPNRAFLHKPFTPDLLLRRVRELLDTPGKQVE